MKKITLSLFLLLSCAFSTQFYAQDFTQNLRAEFQQKLENREISQQDTKWEVTSQHISKVSGIQHIYFNQTLNGIQINGTESDLHILPSGKTLSSSINFIKNASEKVIGSKTPSISASNAVQSAASQLGYTINGPLSELQRKNGPSQEILLSKGGISLSEIPAKLMYALTDANELILAWDISIQEKSQQDWWSLCVNASTGAIVNKENWIVSCEINHDHSNDTQELNYNTNLFDIPNYDELKANVEEGGCTECYEVFALPLESPYYGSRSVEVQPADDIASPFGWHDTDGTPGAEFTTTRGNNVNAYEDGNNPGYQPDAGTSLDFSGYPFSQIYTGANQYEDAAITNLFYMNNVFHDIMYQFGFDDVSGNFQENNYGNGGLGSDSVNAEAQDGSGTCNANFGTPPDGGNPTMQMYICGDKDGDFDNLVILHEYGHGVSNRLTGGAAAAGCLQNSEQMGEGWSDFFGTILTIEPGDTGADSRAVGTYLFGQGQGGGGIRDYPYSTDMGVNPQTYDFIKTAAVPHGVGSVWAEMLWEMTWTLIDEHGFDPDYYNFTGDVTQDAGNIMALALVTEGMKLQPCSPGFVDGRDAIIAADQAIYGGANECLIWEAFAKRGLGFSASQGSSGSRGDGTEAFDLPPSEAQFNAPADVCASSETLTDLGGGSPVGGVYSGPGVTDDGNGLTYSFDPSAAGVGVHTISYEVPEGQCTTASTDTDTIEVLAIPDGPTTQGVSDFCIGDEVTVTATPSDSNNVIGWYDAEFGGNLLFEGESYTFTPTGTTTVYAQENPDAPLSKLVISELTLETPDRFEIQNVGVSEDYSSYTVAVSEDPYNDINAMNPITNTLGQMSSNSVVQFNDDGGADYWGNNLFWDNDGTGWIIIIDADGNVVDSVFWNFTAAQIAGLNVTINGFAVTAADLDWSGDGASLLADCGGSFRRTGDTDSAADWSGVCETSDYGVPNDDINVSPFEGCLAARTAAEVTVEDIAPEVTCPGDVSESINEGEMFTLPDYTGDTTATDNCVDTPSITQDPAPGTQIGEGTTVVTMTASDGDNEAICTFNVAIEIILGVGDAEFYNNVSLYPNPTNGQVTLENKSNKELRAATITDVNGRIIQTINLENSGVETLISMDQYASGMYFVKIEATDANIVKRIVKQ
jgi:extracellular elastinolytic metalloproteinase|tara:strand:- start:151341 stop:154790 length:3450 start_codon:yes stop_codon:yes gene_type:complete